MFARMLERYIRNSFMVVPRAGEDGVYGGGIAEEFGAVGDDHASRFMRQALESDDELAGLLEDEDGENDGAGAGADGDASEETDADIDDVDDDEEHDDDGDGDDGKDTGDAGEPSVKKDTHDEFADDVIPGLKGDDFAKISEDGQLALA